MIGPTRRGMSSLQTSKASLRRSLPVNMKSWCESNKREVHIAYECVLNPQIPTHKTVNSPLRIREKHCPLSVPTVWSKKTCGKGLRKELQAATSEKLPWNCTGICGRSKRSVLSKWMRSRGLTPTFQHMSNFPRLKAFPSDFKFQTSPC